MVGYFAIYKCFIWAERKFGALFEFQVHYQEKNNNMRITCQTVVFAPFPSENGYQFHMTPPRPEWL